MGKFSAKPRKAKREAIYVRNTALTLQLEGEKQAATIETSQEVSIKGKFVKFAL
jgi:hypothetical protein